MTQVHIVDTTLRDGSHTVSHQFSPEDVAAITKALDKTGIPMIEVGHGDGLSGQSINYGLSQYSDFDLISAAVSATKNADIAALLIPGIGTIEDLLQARDIGVKAVRIATHVTEADVAAQHIQAAKKMGFFTIGFLMMAHMVSAQELVVQAKKMESYGADVVYCTDSAGAMLPSEVREKIGALSHALAIPIGHHSHNNLGLAIGNSLAAIEAGATYLDVSLCGMGAGAGNTATETLIAALNKQKVVHHCDLFGAIDAAAQVLQPILNAHQIVLPAGHDALVLGYAGVYSSFMLHAQKAAERFGVDYRDIIIEAGKRQAVGGQEDWLVEIASMLAKQKK